MKVNTPLNHDEIYRNNPCYRCKHGMTQALNAFCSLTGISTDRELLTYKDEFYQLYIKVRKTGFICQASEVRFFKTGVFI